jgi:hypothetical protein
MKAVEVDRDEIILQRCLARAMRRAARRQQAEAARMREDLAAAVGRVAPWRHVNRGPTRDP